MHWSWRSSPAHVFTTNALCLQGVARARRATDGAALSAAPDSDSDQRRTGTQDVNDPASGPAMRPEGRSGSFTSWVPRVASHWTDQEPIPARIPGAGPR
jgi:hypothetical protein